MDHYTRGLHLFGQERFDLAEKEFRLALTAQPNSLLRSHIHALLGWCLFQLNKPQEALAEAEQAIALSPDSPTGHYVLGLARAGLRHYPEALAAFEETIRLKPHDADAFGMKSTILHEQRQWRAALEAADQGLAIDPTHQICINVRAMCLRHLGQHRDAGAVIADALARDPNDALTHANMGWNYLENGDCQQAVHHFRESLRLEPNDEYARSGILEAIKSRNVVYRGLFYYYLWVSRLDQRVAWFFIFGMFILAQMLANVGKRNPELAPYTFPILMVYGAFVLSTWLGKPLFNFTLRFHPLGRYALSSSERWSSFCVGSVLMLALVMALVYMAVPADLFLISAIQLCLLTVPVASVFECEAGWPRRIMILLSIGLGIWTITPWLCVFSVMLGWMDLDTAKALTVLLIKNHYIGVFIVAIAANAFPAVQVRK